MSKKKLGKITVPQWKLITELHAAIVREGRPVQMWECASQHPLGVQLACEDKDLIVRSKFIPQDEDARSYDVFTLAFIAEFALGVAPEAARARQSAETRLHILRGLIADGQPGVTTRKKLADAVRDAHPGIDVIGTIDYALHWGTSITQAANAVRKLTKKFRAPALIA